MKGKRQETKTEKRKRRSGGCTGWRLRGFLIVIFAAVYFLSMLLATWLDQLGIRADNSEMLSEVREAVSENLLDEGRYREEQGTFEEEGWEADCLRASLSLHATYYSTEVHLVSGAVYDVNGSLIARSTNLFADDSHEGYWPGTVNWKMSDYLTDEEIEKLAGYEAENYRVNDGNITSYYVIETKKTEDARLAAVNVTQRYNSTDAMQNDGLDSLETSREVWAWENPDVAADAGKNGNTEKDAQTFERINVYLPGIQSGTDVWHEWMDSRYLQEYPGQLDDQYFRADGHFVILAENGTENGIEIGDQTAPLFASEDYSRPDYTLVLRLVEHPWRAAAASMGNIYLWGALLTLVCILLVLYIVEVTFRKRAAMERQQRDFTNAIAHEMKTPLAVIRGFAENLEENTNEEKKKYYLEQIIGQTERMDDMVKEMVFISRMDSKEYRPVKEQISVRKLIDELAAAYSAQIEEKQIELSVSCREDFLIDGDRRFVEKAFAGLLSNAVDHNRQEGKIRIDIDRDMCVIANTGERIPEEDLPRVCELFFTGNKSRGGEEKHLGIGLYLADRIFRTHGLGMKVENTACGVQVSVKKDK